MKNRERNKKEEWHGRKIILRIVVLGEGRGGWKRRQKKTKKKRKRKMTRQYRNRGERKTRTERRRPGERRGERGERRGERKGRGLDWKRERRGKEENG